MVVNSKIVQFLILCSDCVRDCSDSELCREKGIFDSDKPHCVWNNSTKKCGPDKGECSLYSLCIEILILEYINCGKKLIEMTGCTDCGDQSECGGECWWREDADICVQIQDHDLPASYTVISSGIAAKIHPEVLGVYNMSYSYPKAVAYMKQSSGQEDLLLFFDTRSNWRVSNRNDLEELLSNTNDDQTNIPPVSEGWKVSILTSQGVEWLDDVTLAVLPTRSACFYSNCGSRSSHEGNIRDVLIIVFIVILIIILGLYAVMRCCGC